MGALLHQLGMVLAAVNTGTLIIALPDLERSLHTTLLQLVWVILVYIIDRPREEARSQLVSKRKSILARKRELAD